MSPTPKKNSIAPKPRPSPKKDLVGDGFSLEDFRDQLRQIKKFGSMQSNLKMFLNVAETTNNIERILRRHRDGRKSYRTVVRLIPRVQLMPEDELEMSRQIKS